MPKIHLPQLKRTLDCEDGENLMDVLVKNQIPVASSCLGEGVCSKCYVTVKTSDLPSAAELNTLIRNKLNPSGRLSCQVTVIENLTIETTYW